MEYDNTALRKINRFVLLSVMCVGEVEKTVSWAREGLLVISYDTLVTFHSARAITRQAAYLVCVLSVSVCLWHRRGRNGKVGCYYLVLCHSEKFPQKVIDREGDV